MLLLKIDLCNFFLIIESTQSRKKVIKVEKKQSFSERLKIEMGRNNVSIQDLSSITGVSYEMARRYVNGTAEPRTNKLRIIANALNTTPEYLQFGAISDGIKMEDMRETDEWDGNTPLNDDEVEVPYYKSIELAAGHGSASQEDYNGFKLRFGKAFFRRKGVQKEFVACFPAKGNSMEPIIPNGATVAVDTSKNDVVDGDIYMICQDDLCRIKRLYLMPGNQLRINSFNEAEYKDEYVDLSTVRIVGRVFYYSVEL